MVFELGIESRREIKSYSIRGSRGSRLFGGGNVASARVDDYVFVVREGVSFKETSVFLV
jgi:hypothetical protein